MGPTELRGLPGRKESECSSVEIDPVKLTALALFFLPCALWATLVGEADLMRNTEWGCQRLETIHFLITPKSWVDSSSTPLLRSLQGLILWSC